MDLIFRIDGEWYHERCNTPDEGADFESYTEDEADRVAGHGTILCLTCNHAVTPQQQADWDYALSLSLD